MSDTWMEAPLRWTSDNSTSAESLTLRSAWRELFKCDIESEVLVDERVVAKDDGAAVKVGRLYRSGRVAIVGLVDEIRMAPPPRPVPGADVPGRPPARPGLSPVASGGVMPIYAVPRSLLPALFGSLRPSMAQVPEDPGEYDQSKLAGEVDDILDMLRTGTAPGADERASGVDATAVAKFLLDARDTEIFLIIASLPPSVASKMLGMLMCRVSETVTPDGFFRIMAASYKATTNGREIEEKKESQDGNGK